MFHSDIKATRKKNSNIKQKPKQFDCPEKDIAIQFEIIFHYLFFMDTRIFYGCTNMLDIR